METIAFARGVPAPEMLPVDELQACAQRAFAADPVSVLSYGTGGGYAPLRAHLAEQHGVEASRIVVTSGSLQGFVLLAEVLAARARAAGREPVAIVENPTYDRPLILLRRAGWRVEHVRMDADGLDLEALRETAAGGPADLLYTIPTFQNPAGATLAETRRDAVLDIAREAGILVLEDDPYGLLHFTAPAPRTLFERATGDDAVVYSSSFSKTISPGLRVGYLVMPTTLAGELERVANDTYISPSLLAEAIVLEFLRSETYLANLESLRTQLAQRCDLLCSALERHVPEATFARPGGGYFLWAELPGVPTSTLLGASAERGVSFVPGEAFGPGNEHALRLAFSSPAAATIEEGVRRLAGALASIATRA